MSGEKKKLKDFPLKGQKVLLRVDFNVPLDAHQQILDETRIKAALPSLKYILTQGGSVVLLSHLGRPKGRRVQELSLKPIQKRLSLLLGFEVKFVEDCVGAEAQNAKKKLNPKEVLLLENLRFYEAEEKPEKDPCFAKELASFCDLYVNDAFSVAHRHHASVSELAHLFPEKALMGFGLSKEEEFLKKKLFNPKRPFVALIGGAKISSKIGVIRSLLDKVDLLLIGGAMAHTFLKAKGFSIGKSLNEPEYELAAKEILAVAEKKKIPLILPVDLVVTTELKKDAFFETVPIEAISENQIGVDVGEKTLQLYEKSLAQAETVFWNGPLGVTEYEVFSKGTEAFARMLGKLEGAITIVGGGDSIAALNKLKLTGQMSYVSMGGGASLEYIEKGTLPGIEALSNQT